MTGSNKSKNTATSSADSLTKGSADASIELSEAALGAASGGAVFPSSPALSALKLDSSLKLENKASDPNLLLPAVKPIG